MEVKCVILKLQLMKLMLQGTFGYLRENIKLTVSGKLSKVIAAS
jgi:hypothetical protein